MSIAPNPIGKTLLANAGTTGNNTHTAIDFKFPPVAAPQQVSFVFVVEAAGATPTVTFKYQGSHDNSNWFDLPYITDASDTLSQATRVVTATGASIQWLAGAHSRQFRFYRLVTTANTNVTYRSEIYVQNA